MLPEKHLWRGLQMAFKGMPLFFCVGVFFVACTPLAESPEELVRRQLCVSALSPNSVWNQEFLRHNLKVR